MLVFVLAFYYSLHNNWRSCDCVCARYLRRATATTTMTTRVRKKLYRLKCEKATHFLNLYAMTTEHARFMHGWRGHFHFGKHILHNCVRYHAIRLHFCMLYILQSFSRDRKSTSPNANRHKNFSSATAIRFCVFGLVCKWEIPQEHFCQQ